MSILVCEMLPIGIVFAADKNVTIPSLDDSGNVVATVQDLGIKILRWPRNRALLGYVGRAAVGNQSMHDWLHDFMGDHIAFTDPEAVAIDMRDRLQSEIGGPGACRSIVEFAAFAKREGVVVPEFWHVTNVHGITDEEYDPPSETFKASERLLGFHLRGQASPQNIRDYLADRARCFDPLWFRQGFGLTVFNTVTEAVRLAFIVLQGSGSLGPPQTLEDWERHAKMWVLIYGAYFEAFGAPGQRYVGGGADSLSIPWPDDV